MVNIHYLAPKPELERKQVTRKTRSLIYATEQESKTTIPHRNRENGPIKLNQQVHREASGPAEGLV